MEVIPPNSPVTVHLSDTTINVRMSTLQEVLGFANKVKCGIRPQDNPATVPRPLDYFVDLKDITMEEFTEVISMVVNGKLKPRYYNLLKKYNVLTPTMQQEYNTALCATVSPPPSSIIKKKKYELLKTFYFSTKLDDDMDYMGRHYNNPWNPIGLSAGPVKCANHTVSIDATENYFDFGDLNPDCVDILR